MQKHTKQILHVIQNYFYHIFEDGKFLVFFRNGQLAMDREGGRLN